MSKRNFFWGSSDNTQPEPGSAGEAVTKALNRIFGQGNEFHNIPETQAQMAQTAVTHTPTSKPSTKPSKNAFRMASDQSRQRRVNPADAMEPQDPSMMGAYQWLGKAIEGALGDKTITHPDLSMQSGTQWVGNSIENALGNKVLTHPDQSAIPAVQAALRNVHNNVYERHGDAIRKTSGTEGENGAKLPSYAEEIGRGALRTGLKTTESLQNNGIAGAELVHGVFGGNRDALDIAYDNKARLTKIIADYEDETDRLHRDANSADKTLRGFYQGVGQAGVEGVKYLTTKGGSLATDGLDTFSKLYHGHYDRTGKRDVGLALEGGGKALALYEGAFAAAYHALKPLPAPDSLKRFGAGMAASEVQDVFVENELNKHGDKPKY